MSKILNAVFGNWRTTLAGVIAAVGAYLITQPGAWGVIGQVLIGAGTMFLGVNGKDAQTGSPALPPKP